MLASLLLTLALAHDAPHRTTSSPTCIDPATPLQRLALQYDRWPAPQKGVATKGFALLRKAMQTHKPSDYGTAMMKYQNLDGDQMHSTVPHVQLAIGILYLTGYEFNFNGSLGYRHSRPRYNTNAERVAGDLLPQVVAADPKQWLAAVALTRLAMQSRGEHRFEQAREALQRVLNAEPQNITAHLAWRDILVAQDSTKQALVYISQHAVDCVPVMHAQAELMMINGDTAGGSHLYIKALAQAQPDELDRFYQDLLVMVDRRALEEYHALDASKRAEWIRRYWERSAAEAGRTVETRVAEQIVRAAFADASFVRDRVQSVVAGRNAFVDDSIASAPWDLRGVMYVRHGAPVRRMRFAGECNGYEGWVYMNDGNPWVLGFTRGCGANDWVLEQAPQCGVGPTLNDFLGEPPADDVILAKSVQHPDSMDLREIYRVMAYYDPRYADLGRYCQILAAGGHDPRFDQLRRDIAAERRNLVDSIQWGGTAYRQFLYGFRFEVDAYQFRNMDSGGAGKADVAVMAWIPVADLAARTGMLPLPRVSTLDLSYTLIDPAAAPQRRTASIGVPATGSGAMRAAYILRNIDAGNATLHVIAVDPSDTTRGGSRRIPLGVRPVQSGLDMSDVVLAEPSGAGAFARGDVRISPLAMRTALVGSTIRVFFEAYGLTEGQEFKQDIRVVRTSKVGVRELLNVFPGRKDERTITLTENARHDGRGVTIRDVELAADFVPGEYEVEITLTAGGKTVRRRTTLYIEPPT